VWWLAGAGALAAAAIAVAVVARGPAPVGDRVASTVVRIGGRVALVPSPDAVYTIARSTADEAEVAVVEGTVTARLYPGAAPYRLRMTAEALDAVATGTIFTVGKPRDGRAYTVVHEGHVRVVAPDGAHEVRAGQSWPVTPPSPAITAAAQRLADQPASAAAGAGPAPPLASPAAPEPSAVAPDAPAASTAPVDAASPSAGSASVPLAPHAAPGAASAATTLDDHWQRARRLRGQGHPRDALAELHAMIDRDDAVWSPIAIAEAMRIEASVLGDHAAVVVLGDQFLGRYPAHSLAREVVDMVCRAHRALGDQDLPSACLLGHPP
jgi:hypothetical protein